GKRAMQFAQGQSREQAERVQMTAMIGHNNKRSICPEMFVTDNFKSVIGTQPPPYEQCGQRTNSVNKHVRLARKSPQPFNQALVEIAGGVVVPFLHRNP